jgi:hypothetical protein
MFSLYLLGIFLQQRNFRMAILLGALFGLTANIHSLNALIIIFSIGALFLFLPEKLSKKFFYTGTVFGAFLLFGGLHYFIDLTIGTGWILGQ